MLEVYFTAPSRNLWPTRKHGAAGFDLRCAETVELPPHASRIVKTRVRIAFPNGVAGLVIPRSSWRLKGIICLALFDPGFDGEVNPVVTNLNAHPLTIEEGERFAQLLFLSPKEVVLIPSDGETITYLNSQFTERGSHGLGSTGR